MQTSPAEPVNSGRCTLQPPPPRAVTACVMPPATHPARVEINRQIVDVFVHGPILPPSRARPFPGGCKCPVPGMPPANALPHANTELTAIKHLPHRTPSNSSGIYARTGRSAAPIAIIFPAPVSPDSDMQCQARDRCANAPDFLPARRKYRQVHKGTYIPGTRSLGSQLPNKRGFTFPAQRAHSGQRTQHSAPIYSPSKLDHINCRGYHTSRRPPA